MPPKALVLAKKKVVEEPVEEEPVGEEEDDEEELRKQQEALQAKAKALKAKKAAAEEARKKAEAEEERKKEAAQAAVEEARKKAEAAAAEEAQKKAEAEAAAEETRKKAEAEAATEEARKKAEAEAAAEEARKKVEAEAAAEEARKKSEAEATAEEARKKAATIEVKKKAAAEAMAEIEAEKKAATAVVETEGEVETPYIPADKVRENNAHLISQEVMKNVTPKVYTKVPRNIINSRYSFTDGKWMDKGTYYLNSYDQGTEGWKKSRYFRLTASNFGAAAGLSDFEGSSPLEVGMDITRIKPKIFSEKSVEVMAHGTKMEPAVRKWYSDKIGKPIVEVGLAVPKWEVRIGGSLDGDIEGTDGCIEIKCPQKMYGPLIDHFKKVDAGWEPPKFYHDHIWKTHYAQMQGCMKITGKMWCDYIVYCHSSKQFFQDRVIFNPDYWNNFLYPKIQEFLDNILEPLIEDGAQCYLISHLL